MRYLCLVHIDGKELFETTLDDAGKRQLDTDSMNYDKDLERSGNLILAEALDGPESGVLVQMRNGRISTTDGPFTETKEQLGGFILIEARDLNEAIRIAGGIPLAKWGTIEVRPIHVWPDA